MLYTDRIRALHEDNDLTQTQAAALLNVGQMTYSDYESGRTRIPVERLLVLAKYYDVSMDYISGASDIKSKYPVR